MTRRPVLPGDVTTDPHVAAATTALLPVGSLEQHGPHLPLVTDTVVATLVADAVARVHPVRVLPAIPFGCSHEHAGWPGTVSVSASTLAAVVDDVAASLAASGVLRLVVVNGHGGNHVLANVVQTASAAGRPTVLFPTEADWRDADAAAGLETPFAQDMHAGERETSLLLHARPELVRDGWRDADHLGPDPGVRRHFPTLGMRGYTTSGVVGRPSRASAAKGAALLDALVRGFGAHLAALDDVTPPR